MVDRLFVRTLFFSRAVAGSEIKWLRNITIAAAAGAIVTVIGIGTTPLKTFAVTWALSAALFALWEFAGFLKRRFFDAPYAVYVEQLAEIAAVEARVADRETVIAGLRGEIARLNAAFQRRVNYQAIADYLTERHAYGIREILNRAPSNRDGVSAWRAIEAEFTAGVLTEMAALGCSVQDVHGVEYIGSFQLIYGHQVPEVASDLSMFDVRLNRIGEVSTRYAELAERERRINA
jgi:hypothetical protein